MSKDTKIQFRISKKGRGALIEICDSIGITMSYLIADAIVYYLHNKYPGIKPGLVSIIRDRNGGYDCGENQKITSRGKCPRRKIRHEELVSLRESGYTYKQLAEHFDCSMSSIAKHIKRKAPYLIRRT